MTPRQPASELRPDDRDRVLAARQHSRERRKLVGLIVIALFILALAFLRFGRTIPWGAR